MNPTTPAEEPVFAIPNQGVGVHDRADNASAIAIPRLAFGLYKVPANNEGEGIIWNAIQAGYRHFDSASKYGNEATLGRVLSSSRLRDEEGLSRNDFYLTSKVWNDAQRRGRAAVRQSVLQSIQDLRCDYLDLFYIHWPVPNHFVDTYLELQELCREGLIRNIGLSNFGIADYEKLQSCAQVVTKWPVVNQIEISPFMYRPRTIEYFQQQKNHMAASKALFRMSGGAVADHGAVQAIAKIHEVTPAQVMLRWSLQKGLIPLAKTSSSTRMQENRNLFHFALSDTEMSQLDALTSEKDIEQREALEVERKMGD